MFTTRSPCRPALATDGAAARTGVLLVGHGAARHPQAAATLARHAAAVARDGGFAQVRHACLNGGPDPAVELRAIAGLDRVLVLPVFMCAGLLVRQLLAELPRGAGGGKVGFCPPLGACPEFAALAGAVAGAARDNGQWRGRDPLLMIAAHGSPHDPASRQAASRLTRRLARGETWPAVRAAFLEEPPFLADAVAALRQPAVVLGLFAADGRHAAGDVPAALARAPYPVAYTGALGADPRIPDVMLKILARKMCADIAA